MAIEAIETDFELIPFPARRGPIKGIVRTIFISSFVVRDPLVLSFYLQRVKEGLVVKGQTVATELTVLKKCVNEARQDPAVQEAARSLVRNGSNVAEVVVPG